MKLPVPRSVKLIAATEWLAEDKTLERDDIVAYIARVSNPSNQDNVKTGASLLNFLMKQHHVSPFEMANMTVEVNTSRAVSAQIIRHKSIAVQEFSQRYANTNALQIKYPVMRDVAENGDRQSSSEESGIEAQEVLMEATDYAYTSYDKLIQMGVAKECARMTLPMSAPTRIYMNGTLRSWIHYLQLRCDEHTQLEHRELAYQILEILKEQYPTVGQMVSDSIKHAQHMKEQKQYAEVTFPKAARFGEDPSVSDGSTASYYELPEGATQLQDLISHKNMNGQIAEIMRSIYRFGESSHSDQLRDIKKVMFYAQAEHDRLIKLEKDNHNG